MLARRCARRVAVSTFAPDEHSEPHLHFGVVVIDQTGRPTIAPVAPRRTKTTGGVQITGTPSSDQYLS